MTAGSPGRGGGGQAADLRDRIQKNAPATTTTTTTITAIVLGECQVEKRRYMWSKPSKNGITGENRTSGSLAGLV